MPIESVSSEELLKRFPVLAISQTQDAFQLPDRSMRTDLLLDRLAEAAENSGVEIRCDSSISRLLYQGESVQGVALKTHLAGVRPMLSQWPLCVVDADGFNHLPHQPMSVFGTSRWLPVRHGEDEQAIPEAIERIWNHWQRLFPGFQRSDHRVIEWAGTTVQAIRVEEIHAAQIPQPTIVDHQQESYRADNLVSVFPGRATLWAHLADKTCAVVQAKLGTRAREIARPPWGTPCGDLHHQLLA